jgi:hypothetical protein
MTSPATPRTCAAHVGNDHVAGLRQRDSCVQREIIGRLAAHRQRTATQLHPWRDRPDAVFHPALLPGRLVDRCRGLIVHRDDQRLRDAGYADHKSFHSCLFLRISHFTRVTRCSTYGFRSGTFLLLLFVFRSQSEKRTTDV